MRALLFSRPTPLSPSLPHSLFPPSPAHRRSFEAFGPDDETSDQARVVNLTRITDRFLRSVLEEFEGGRSKTDFSAALASGAAGGSGRPSPRK